MNVLAGQSYFTVVTSRANFVNWRRKKEGRDKITLSFLRNWIRKGKKETKGEESDYQTLKIIQLQVYITLKRI